MLPLKTPVLLERDGDSFASPLRAHLLPRVVERADDQVVARPMREDEVPAKLSIKSACGTNGWLYLYDGIILEYTEMKLCGRCERLSPQS